MSLLVLLFLTLLLVPAAAAVHQALAPRAAGRDTGWFAAVVLLVLGAAALPWLSTITAGEVLSEHLPWIPSLDVGVSLRLDGLGMVFLLLVLFIGALVMAYSARYFAPSKKTGDYYIWMLLFVFAMSGMVLADDLILLFVFWEFTTLCSFFLINRSGEKAPMPAQRTLLITMGGGLGLLVAALMIISETGTTRISEALEHSVWQQDPSFTAIVAALVALAAFTKSAQFPFHMWLPDAMVAPAPVSAYLHAAAMVKAGVYLLLRFSPAFHDTPLWQGLLLSCGIITALIGALFACQRHDIKEIMAFSTVSQLGFLVAVIGIGTPTAMAAATVHVIAHALFKSALFMMVGVIEHQAHSRDIRRLHGLHRLMRASVLVTAVAALSMAGVPPLLGFVSKEHLLTGLLSADSDGTFGPVLTWTIAAAAVAAAIGTFAYSGRIVLGSFTGYTGAGPRDEQGEPIALDDVREASAGFLLPALLPAAVGLVLGLVPQLLDGLVSASASAAAGEAYAAHFALWHGITAELGLSAIIIGLGTTAVLLRRRLDGVIPRTVLPFTGVQVVERIREGLILLGRRAGDLTRTDMHGLHLLAPGLLLAGVLVAGLIASPKVGELEDGSTRVADWLFIAVMAVFLLGAVVAKNRAAAVVLAGGAGFVVSAYYFTLGAIDVGLTQLLVEILTVVVLVLVLRKLPAEFHRVRRSRTVAAVVIAGGFGLMAFLGTYALTGRRGRHQIAENYLQNTYENTGADNIVNSILVDFRALDTFGELTVLGIAGFAILAVLNSAFSTSDNAPKASSLWKGTPIDDARDNTTAMRSVFNWMAPFIVIFSLMLLLRGHYEPGGGFIAALVAGGFFALRYLVAPSDSAVKLRWDYALVIVGGILIGAGTGFAGLVDGSYLRPVVIAEGLPLPWGSGSGFTLSTALIFDVGIYLAVIGTVLVALDRLGQAQRYPAELLDAYRRSHGYPEDADELPHGADPGDLPPEVEETELHAGHTLTEGDRDR